MPKFLEVTNAAAARTALGVSSVGDDVVTAVDAAAARSAINADHGVNVKDFSAVGNGVATDTSAIQSAINACAANGVVYFPPGTYKTGPLTVATAGLTLTGPGTLSFTGVESANGIAITADRVTVQGLRLMNPSSVGTPTGNKQIGIFINANEAAVLGCFLEGWQNGIVVNDQGPTGTSADERRNIRIHFNRVKDVVGVGGGPSSSSSYGEDRGDGITSWGAQVSIVGNIVNAKAGTDARIGIHVEQLYGTGVAPNLHESALATILGNVVTGRFRRGIVDEMVDQSTIVGNVVADSTWWGIALARTKDCVVADNTVLWTRESSDNQGSTWSPLRVGIMVYGESFGSRITGNTCRVAATGVLPVGIKLQAVNSSDNPVNTYIAGNSIHVDSGGTLTNGIESAGHSDRTIISANHLSGPMERAIKTAGGDDDWIIENNVIEGAITASGIYMYLPVRPLVSGNLVRTPGVNALYVECGSPQTQVSCVNNTFINTGSAAGTTAMQIINAGSDGSIVLGNRFVNFALGAELFGTTTFMDGNIYKDVSTPYQNGPVTLGVTSTGAQRLASIELGDASDTTIARASAGVVTIEGNTVSTRLTNTAALDFGSVSAQSQADLTITVTGAATGDAVALGVPTAAVTAGIVYSAWVSATNTVTVRAANYTAGALDPASGTFRATIIR